MRLTCLLLLASGAATAQPKRIVSLAPSTTEILFAIGAGDRVIGVTNYCHFPPDALRLPKVGGYLHPSLEAIAALEPDLVVAQKSSRRVGAALVRLGIRTLELGHDDIAGVYRSIATLGAATGNIEAAATVTARIRAGLEAVRRSAGRLPRRRVTFIVGRSPGSLDGLTAVGGRASYLDQLLAVAGGDNVFAGEPVPYPRVSIEEILARDPEVIIDMGTMAQTTGVTEADKTAVRALWDRYPVLTAVRERRVYAVASDIFVVPGPRVVEAARAFLAMIHPEAQRWR
jgi:iron complex transport system substrate-binding protein